MKQNVRFFLTVVFVLVVVAAVWWLLFRQETEAPSGPEMAREDITDGSREAPPSAPVAQPEDSPQRLDQGAVGTRIAPDAPAAARRATGGSTLTGLVLDEALNPAPGVEVTAQRTNSEQGERVAGEPAPVATGPDGMFSFDGLASGGYDILAIKDDLAATQFAQVRPDWFTSNLVLQLRPAYSLAGRVATSGGEPVALAQVTVMHIPSEAIVRQRGRLGAPEDMAQALPMQVATDEQGTFAFERVPLSEVFVAVKAEGYAPYISSLTKLPASNITVTLNSGSSLAGRVLQADTGAPLEGFPVSIKGTTTVDKHEAVTNASGEFASPALRAGEYALVPADDTWVSIDTTPRVAIAPGEARQGIELRVTQGGIIRGRVYSEQTGDGVPGGTVILRRHLMGYDNSVNTGNDGTYEMRGVPPGEHALAIRVADRVVANPGGDQEAALVTMKAGAVLEGIDIPVFMGAAVSGRVECADGSPAGSATVYVNPVVGYNRARIMADRNGAFVLSGPANGEQIRLQAFRGTDASAPTDVLQIPVSGPLEGIVLTLQEGGVIGGIVTNPSGAGLPGMQVLVSGDPGLQLQPHFTFSDENGQFLVAGLAPGTYSVTAMTSNEQGSGDATKKVELAAGQRVNDVVLIWDKQPPGGASEGSLTISGQVVDSSGKPLSDAVVYANVSGTNKTSITRSLLDGSFTVKGLAAGGYKLTALSGGNRTWEAVDAEAGASGVRLTVSTQGKVSGTVVDAATGKPVTRFGVAFVAPGYVAEPSKQYVAWQRYTSPEGEFTVAIREQRHQQSGNLALAVRAEGYAPVEHVLGALSQGQNAEGVVIRMRPGARVEGVVQTTAGQVVAGASIYLERYEQYWPPETRTNAEGKFTMTDLPLATVKLVAAHPAYSNGEVSVTPRAGTTTKVTIELPAGGSVEGIVRMGGQPRPGSSVHLYMYDGGGQQSSTVTDASGRYVFNNVASGRGQVSTYIQSGGGNLNQSRQVIVETDRTTKADFDLPAQTGTLEGIVTIGGQPVGGGHVSAYVSSEEGSTSSYTQIRSDGTYLLESVPVGEVRASVYLPDTGGGQGRQHQETAQIAAGRVTRLDIDLPVPTFVSGYLSGLKEGEAGYIGLLPGKITIGTLTEEKIQEYLGMLAGQAQMNPDGTFRMENVEPGTYTVVGVAADPNAPSPEEALMNARIVTEVIEVREGDEITVNLSVQ